MSASFAAAFARWLREKKFTAADVEVMSDKEYRLAVNLGRLQGRIPEREDVLAALRRMEYAPPDADFSVRLHALAEGLRERKEEEEVPHA